MSDRFGLGWRPSLAAGILAHRDRIDVVEVLAEDYLDRPAREVRALATLSAQIPVLLHGVSLGLASTVPVEMRRLDRLARLIDSVGAESWSEHLAFVRGGGVEIGHLAAPPRTPASIEGTLINLARARRVVGLAPDLENIATLIDPPGSTMDEASWIGAIIGGGDGGLLLDLHNLYANAVNRGEDPFRLLADLPLARVAQVHLGGGRWVEGPNGVRRLLDDHCHDVPPIVFDLLSVLGQATPQNLTIIIERDGNIPPIGHLLDELTRARTALEAGRQRQAA